ncbi:hypothetical protein Trydic_g4448 [Trypoxylus dichotomus]
MPRRTPVKELQAEEIPEGAPRRSSRIAQNSPAPAKIPQRRNSSSDTPAKITKPKRLSLSQESNTDSTDSKTLSNTNSVTTLRKTRSTRSTSKSPTALAKEQETKLAVVKTRGRRGSFSKADEEEVIDSPLPINSRRRSLRSESASPTNLKDVDPSKPKARRGSITEKVTQLEAIEEVEQSPAHPKKRYKARRSSVTEMSQLEKIEETETEKKDLESISETEEKCNKKELSKTNESESKEDEKAKNSGKEDKFNLTAVVRIEKSKTIADLSTSQNLIDTDIKDIEVNNAKSEEVLNVATASKTDSLDSSDKKGLNVNVNSEEEVLKENENKINDPGSSLANTADIETSKDAAQSEVTENVNKSDTLSATTKLAAEDEVIVKDIDKLLGVESNNKESVVRSDKITIDPLPTDTKDMQPKNDQNSDENIAIESMVSTEATVTPPQKQSMQENDGPPSLVLDQDKNTPKLNTEYETELKAGSPLNSANKSLSDIEVQDKSTSETEALNRSGSSDKENTESITPVKDETPKSQMSKENKLPLSNISLNEIESKATFVKEPSHDDSYEPMDVDDPPLIYREISSDTNQESQTNEIKSSTPIKKVRKSTDFDNVPENGSEVTNAAEQIENIEEIPTDNATIENHSATEDKSITNEEDNNITETQDKETIKEDMDVRDLSTSKHLNESELENTKLDEEGYASPVFSINVENTDEEENISPDKKQDASEDNILEIATPNQIVETDISESTSGQSENNIMKTEIINEQKEEAIIPASDEETNAFTRPEYASQRLSTSESLDSSQISNSTQSNLELNINLSSSSGGVDSTKTVEVDIHESRKEEVTTLPCVENTNIIPEKSAEKESSVESCIEKEPVASTSKAANDLEVAYSTEKAHFSRNDTSNNSDIIEKIEDKSNFNDNKILIVEEVGKCAPETSIAEDFEKQDVTLDRCVTTQNAGFSKTPKEVDSMVEAETNSSKENKSDDLNSLKMTSQLPTENKDSTDKVNEEGTVEIGNGKNSIKDVDTKASPTISTPTDKKHVKSPKLQIHSVVELKAQTSPKKSTKTQSRFQANEENKPLKKKHLKGSKCKGSVLSELDEKVTEVIEDALKEIPSSNDNEDVNEFIDDMAEEGEEDTPSEDSNDIPCEGESINTTDTYTEEEDDYENDSFIDDEEEKHELLSGEEDFLQDKSTKKEKVPKLGHKKSPQLDKTPKKRKRIITLSESEDDYQQEIEEIAVIKNRKSAENVETNKHELTEFEKKTSTSEEVELEGDEVAENLAEIPPDLVPSKSNIILVESDSDSEVLESKEDTHNESIDVSFERKSKRKSSVTIQENIKLEDIEDGELSARISQVVDWFCTGIKGKKYDTGNISLNVSLDYADQSSMEGNLEKNDDDIMKEGSKAKADNKYENDEYTGKKSIVEETASDDVFVDAVTNSEQSTKIHKQHKTIKRKSLQKYSNAEDNEEIPILVELSTSDSKDKHSPKLKEKNRGKFNASYVKPKGKRLSDEAAQDLSPKKYKHEAGFEVEDIVFNKAAKRSKRSENKDAKKENIEDPEIDYHGNKLKKRTKRQRDQVLDDNTFEITESHSKRMRKITSKSIQHESGEDSVVIPRRIKEKKKLIAPLSESGDMLHFRSNTFSESTNKKKPILDSSLKQYISSNTSVSKREVDKRTNTAKKLQRNVSQKLLPTRNVNLDDSWDSEVFEVSLHPSISNKRMVNVGTSKKQKTEGLFSSKDFKNRMLYDPGRVSRMDTKTLLRHRKNV